jgi:hypothetical protein
MTLHLGQGAEIEAADAVDWYNQQRDGLGLSFLEALERLLETIETAPKRFAKVDGTNPSRELPHALMRKFPYRIVFEVKSTGDLMVLAIAHARRHPNYWKGRLSD